MTGWRSLAACAGQPGLFFGPGDTEQWRAHRRREARAKAVCAGCPVRQQCLGFAVASGERSGIWGGLGEDELRALQRGAWHSSAGGPRRRAA